MANKSIHMRKLRHVLKLHCQGHSKLSISSLTRVSRNTVKKYLNAFIALHTTWEEVSQLSDKDLDELFCKEPEVVMDRRLKHLYDFFKSNEHRLKRRGVTRLALYRDYCNATSEGYSQTSYYFHFKLWNRRSQPSMHMTHKSGDKMYVILTGEKLEYVDPLR